MFVAVALLRNAETDARPVAPGPGSKSRPAPFLRFNPASSASAGSLMEGFPLLVHQPLLSAFPPPTQILPKSRRLLAPAAALSVPCQHFEVPLPGAIAVAVPPLLAPTRGPVCLYVPVG